MTILLYRIVVLLLACSVPVWAATSEQVNTTAAQTLTNKTLTSPIVNNPTVNGTVAGGASYTAPTLTGPIMSGAIGGSATWPSPGAIGGTTPAAGTFSTLTATTLFVGTPKIVSGAGSPEGVITAVVGSSYLRTDGGSGTTLYLKQSGAGNTGWSAVNPAGGTVDWTAPGTIGSVTPSTGAFTTLSTSGVFTSTLSTGTAPFAIASTTKTTNLNADLLDGTDWTAPGTIGGTTPGDGTFVKLTGTRLVLVTVAPTYGASVAINAAAGGIATITATNGTGFTIVNPTNPVTGNVLSVRVKNTSGGALGTITWDAAYKLGTFTKPTNGYSSTATFFYDGTNWIEINYSPEVPN